MTGPSYPQQYWPPPGPPGVPPRRRTGTVLAVVACVIAILAIGITVVVLRTNQGSSSAPPSAGTFPTSRATTTTVKGRTSRPKAATTRTAPAPTRSRHSAPTTRSATPTRRADPAEVLQRNVLYRVPALHDAGCARAPSAALDSVAGVRAYYGAVMPCLEAAWSQLHASKVAFRPARLVVHSGEPVSSCGARAYSFYCASEQTIYMYAPEMITPWQQYPTEESHRITRLAALHTIAHEYGHHIQYLTGIFGAVGNDWPGTEVERQLELQATCLGNAFLSSQRAVYPISSGDFANQDLWRFITRVPNHGSAGNQERWADSGYDTAKPASCNTFSAPRAQVS